MSISKIGEFGFINKIRQRLKYDKSVIKGSGDDCAVLAFDKKHYQLFTCDMLVEGVDFTANASPYLVGRKALAVSLSDIAACAGIPRHCVVSLGLPKNYSLSKAEKITQGLIDVAYKWHVNLVGGDLSRADKIIIDVSLLGIVEKENLTLRSNAQEKDIIFVSGTLGGSIFGKHLTFTPRLKEARYLVKNFKINAMIDISDGLTQDLSHILEESKVGAVIYERLIPLSKHAKGLSDALNSGEDFELLFTLPVKEARRLIGKAGNYFRPIGEITKRKWGLKLIDKNNREKKIKIKGFRHF